MTSYRKTKKGEWVVFGPTSDVTLGVVTVTKRDGSTKNETVGRLGRSFQVGGVAHVYGYITARAATRTRRPATGVGSWTGCQCGSLDETPRPSDCRSCQFDNYDN